MFVGCACEEFVCVACIRVKSLCVCVCVCVCEKSVCSRRSCEEFVCVACVRVSE